MFIVIVMRIRGVGKHYNERKDNYEKETKKSENNGQSEAVT